MKSPDEKTLTSLTEVLDYLEQTERTHYDECDKAQRQNHIYNHVQIVREWLKE